MGRDKFISSIAFVVIAALGAALLENFVPVLALGQGFYWIVTLLISIGYFIWVLSAEKYPSAAILGLATISILSVIVFGAQVAIVVTVLVMGLIRSFWFYRPNSFLVSLGLELMLWCGGIMLAVLLRSALGYGFAAAVWGYWLVQAIYFLLPVTFSRRGNSGRDPYLRAKGQLLDLLENPS